MNVQSLNELNVLMNVISGNLLPVTSEKTTMPFLLKIYSIFAWIIMMGYVSICIAGAFHVSREKALRDSTVNIIVASEVFLLVLYLQNRRHLLCELIEKLNTVLTTDDETLRTAVIKTVKPLEKPLQIYTIAAIGSVLSWTSMPLLKILKKNEFGYDDFTVPVTFTTEPFSTGVFVFGVFLVGLGAACTVFKKTSLDLYTMHVILVMTAQYRYLRVKLAIVFREENFPCLQECSDKTNICAICETIHPNANRCVKEELNLLIRHHGVVVQAAALLKELFSTNVTVLYISSVFRFCFLGFMFIAGLSSQLETLLIVMYTFGALTQLYILCFCIQQLFEASTKLADDAFHEKWYTYGAALKHMFAVMALGNQLECRLSNCRNIDLTLPSFMSILNQAYSVCLLFLKAQRD